MVGAKEQPSSDERTRQQEQGTARRISVSSKDVLQPPPPRHRGTQPGKLPRLGPQHAAGLLVAARPAVSAG